MYTMIMPPATPPHGVPPKPGNRIQHPRRPSSRRGRLFLVALRLLVLGRAPELLAPVLALLACGAVSIHAHIPSRDVLCARVGADVRCCLLAFSILDAMPYRTSL
jgi:hypothetical protein